MHSTTFNRSVLCGLLVLASWMTACRENQVVGEKPDSAKPVLTVTQALQPSNFDRTINVQGVVKEVCREEGCWMTITDGKKTVRMTFRDEGFRVALKSQGEVLVTGIMHEEIVDADAVSAIGSTLGISEDSLQKLSGDQRWPLMTASGVEFLQPQP